MDNLENFIKLIKPNDDNEASNTDIEKCKECKGVCCKSGGCVISPDDLISVDEQSLINLLNTGFVSIDWWENLYVEEDDYYGPGYYLRMRHLNSDIVDPADRLIQCRILGDNGCPLDFEHRPKGARQLSPSLCRKDITREEIEEQTYSKYKCVMDWYKYIKLLRKLRFKY